MTQPSDDFQIVTCSDENFFKFLPSLERNIFRRFGRYPVIYDLGLTEAQIKSLKSEVLRVPVDDSYRDMTTDGFIRTTHKPDCIAHFLETQKENCLYADADTFFIETIDSSVFAGADIAVTPRHPRELLVPDPLKNGKINAGVLYFRNSPKAREMIVAWAGLCQERSMSDQLAMSNLLESAGLTEGFGMVDVDGASILKLDPLIYNDTGCSQGDIWHFKNAGRRFHKFRRRALVGLLDDISPALLKKYAKRKSKAAGST